MAIQEDLLDRLRTDARFRAAVRLEVLGEELLDVPARLERVAASIDRLEAAIERHDRQIAGLIAAHQASEERLRRVEARLDRVEARLGRVEARLEQVEARLEHVEARLGRIEEHLTALAAAQERTQEQLVLLTAAVQRLEGEVGRLADWERGERGRREGERFERDTIRRAYGLFCGGRPLAERLEDLDRVRAALTPFYSRPGGIPDLEDPFLADLIWLKGDRTAVVEISRQVDDSDVNRAERRAATLSDAGIPAVGIVIGRDWAAEEIQRLAGRLKIEWRVAEGCSGGFEELRRMPLTS